MGIFDKIVAQSAVKFAVIEGGSRWYGLSEFRGIVGLRRDAQGLISASVSSRLDTAAQDADFTRIDSQFWFLAAKLSSLSPAQPSP